MEFPEPVIRVAIEPKTKADQEKMALALQRLAQEEKQAGWNALPAESRALLIAVPCAWILIGAAALFRAKKTKQKN